MTAHRSQVRGRVLALPGALLLLAAAGCAQEVGEGAVEQSIREAMAAQQVDLATVDCPGPLPAEEDAVVICPVTLTGTDDAGTPIDRIRVVVTGIEGSEVRYRLEPLAAGVPDDAVATTGDPDATDG